MRIFLFAVLSFYFAMPFAFAKKNDEKIRLINWWEYTHPKSVAKLKAAGFAIQLTVYKSNETGLARLLNKSNDFDIGIVSNEILPILLESGVIEPAPKDFSSDEFEPFLRPKAGLCIPYLWGSTVFAYDPHIVSAPIHSMAELAALTASGKKVAVIDDSFAVAGRILGDQAKGCAAWHHKGSVFDSLGNCVESEKSLKAISLSKPNFRSDVSSFFTEKDAAASYGWHGSIAAYRSKYPSIEFEPAELNPIIGTDYACVLRKPGVPTKNLKRKIEFITKLTDRESTNWNVETSQYFSPRIGDVEGLDPKIKALREKIMQAIKKSQALIITPPKPEAHKIINSWWQGLRYGG